MKSPNKTLIGLATAAAVVGPMVPKTITININEPSISREAAEDQTCYIVSTIIDDKGRRFCEYRCGKNLRLQATKESTCERTIREGLLKS